MAQAKRYSTSITIPIDSTLSLALMVYAVERGTSRVAVVREILLTHIKNGGNQELSSIIEKLEKLSEEETRKVEEKYLPTSNLKRR